MSSRALRKAQKEREEQERTQFNKSDEEVEDDITQPAALQRSAFALLEEEDDELDDEDDEQGVAVVDHQEEHTEESPSTTRRKKKKKSKKKKAKAPASSEQADGLDDIDLALKELAVKQGGAQSGATAVGLDTLSEDAFKLLAVDKDNLHVHNEMKRLFGRAAVEQDADDAPVGQDMAGIDRRHRRQLQHQATRGRPHGAASLALRRNVFIQGKEEWPLAAGGGLGMELVEKRADGEVEYRYTHHRVYQETQEQFEICVASMDPNRLIDLMHRNPAHISTLLQVSELVKSERGHAQSGEALERALFTMGRAIHSTFAKSLSEGKARLDFRRPENRELWLAGWRYMQNLSMRATWRTVYEWAKMLLALSPNEDPYALWLTLDQYALRSKQDLDYLNLSRSAIFKQVCTSLPNVQLSQGLAEYRSGNKAKGQQQIYSTVSKYPWFLARLMQELDMEVPPAVWGKQPEREKEELHATLYATRAKDIWNTPEHSALLLDIASAVPPDMVPPTRMAGEITLNEARHVILSDIPRLIELVPRHLTTQYTSASDPLPPPDSIDSYNPRARLGAPQHTARDAAEVDQILDYLRSQGMLQEEEAQERAEEDGVEDNEP